MDLLSGLKTSGGEDRDARGTRLLSSRNLVAVAQVALSLMMLAAGGLFVRSAFHAANVEPGFALEREVLVETDPGLAGYDDARARRIDADLLARLRSLPSVESVAFAARVPFGDSHEFVGLRPSGGGATMAVVSASLNSVTEDYFKALGIPLLEGRAFRASEMGGQSQAW
jgi:hypothetical protein